MDQIVPSSEREDGVCYALLHRHFHLTHDEILIAEAVEDTHRVFVEKLNAENCWYEPCMWFPHADKYYAVMFSKTKLSKPFETPRAGRQDVGLIHSDYAYNWCEFTNTQGRTQNFVRDYESDRGVSLVTCVWNSEGSANQSDCCGWCEADFDGQGNHAKYEQP
ncbi:MAG: hypothetical protein AAGJ40_06825 [Planctomycetota bacterium]